MKLTTKKTDTLPEITWEKGKFIKESKDALLFEAKGSDEDGGEYSATWEENPDGIEIYDIECTLLTDLPQDWEPDYNGSSFKESHERAWKEKQKLG